jgi:uncharacterized membrane protein
MSNEDSRVRQLIRHFVGILHPLLVVQRVASVYYFTSDLPRELSGGVPQIPRPRIQGLSDLIFGLALSIGAIQLVGSLPQNNGILVDDIAAFGFSFLILISVWNRYTTTTSVMPVETPILVRLNMLLLFLVTLEPFLFNILTNQSLSASTLAPEVSSYYALDIAGMNAILAYFTHILTLEEKNLIPSDMRRRYRIMRNLLLLGAAIFLVSDLPIFWSIIIGIQLRVIIWILALPILWGWRLFGSRV